MEILKTFKVLLLDADGVFFTGSEFRGTLPSGESVVFKERHYHDGQGLSFLRALGIDVVFVSGEGEPLESIVKKLNNLPSVASGVWSPVEVFSNKNQQGDKVAVIEQWLKAHALAWEDCVYIGDDVNDVEALGRVALGVCPGNATAAAKQVASLILTKDGGRGALREFAEMVLSARGIDEKTLPPA